MFRRMIWGNWRTIKVLLGEHGLRYRWARHRGNGNVRSVQGEGISIGTILEGRKNTCHLSEKELNWMQCRGAWCEACEVNNGECDSFLASVQPPLPSRARGSRIVFSPLVLLLLVMGAVMRLVAAMLEVVILFLDVKSEEREEVTLSHQEALQKEGFL
jgi:hypothetical protein